MDIQSTFIFNPVRNDFLGRAIETLYKYTDMTNNKVIVVDQTKSGWIGRIPEKVHLWLTPHRNLGFAKSHNEGILHALHWGSKYIVCANDDIEFINKAWWQGVLDTFAMEDKIMAVNPESPRIPLWGYGRPHGEYVDILKHKKEYTQEDYDYLLAGDFKDWQDVGELKSQEPVLPASFPLKKEGVCDAVAMWLTCFKRECFERFGLFDERFYPGGGEDYDYDARVYREGGRLVGTTKSWAWHWWGGSKDTVGKLDANIDKELCWQDNSYLWPKERNEGKQMDPWGKVNGRPMYRRPEIGVVEI